MVSDPAPRRAYQGRAPLSDCLCPPKRKLCPPKRGLCLKKLTGLGLLECKSRPKLVFFVDWQRISWRFWDGDLFLWKSPVFDRKNRLNFGQKIPLNLCSSPCSFDPDWDKFLVPPCPPKIYFCPPPPLCYPGAGPAWFLKPHLQGRLFCNSIWRFFMRENLSRKVVPHTRRDSLAAIAFGKNRCRVSNTCDLRCRLYFARLDARIVLACDHLHEVDFNVSRIPGQAKARSCKQQIVCNLRVAGLCESLDAIILNLLHKMWCL